MWLRFVVLDPGSGRIIFGVVILTLISLCVLYVYMYVCVCVYVYVCVYIYPAPCSRTTRLTNSFIHRAVRMLTPPPPPPHTHTHTHTHTPQKKRLWTLNPLTHIKTLFHYVPLHTYVKQKTSAAVTDWLSFHYYNNYNFAAQHIYTVNFIFFVFGKMSSSTVHFTFLLYLLSVSICCAFYCLIEW